MNSLRMNYKRGETDMTIKIYDTMTRSLRDFVPITENTVNMYVCGPTVYNYIHIGNARSVVAFDTIRRYFEYRGYKVNYISNFTDVDDKIIKGAAEVGMDTKAFSDKFIAAFMEDVKQLGVKPATKNPRVIDYMDEIIDFVKVLVDKGFAYEANGDVYFRVAKSQNYAKLANKTLADLEVGASGRVDGEGEIKENPLDFALWKSAKPGEVSWQSPWGEGRLVGILNVLLWRQPFLVIRLIFTVVELTWNFLTIPTKSPNLKPKQEKHLPIIGCTMVL